MGLKNAVLQIVIAHVALCCTAIAPGQRATTNSIDGEWAVSFTIQGQPVSGQMTFQAHGEKV